MANDRKKPSEGQDGKTEKNDQHHDQSRNENFGSGAGGSAFTDTIKKLVTAGVSAAFMTEESIRGFVSELKLPKETLQLILQGASKSKEELMNRVSREIIGVISKIDFVKEASRFLEEHKFRINAEIEVIRKDGTQAKTLADHESSMEFKIKPENKPESKPEDKHEFKTETNG